MQWDKLHNIPQNVFLVLFCNQSQSAALQAAAMLPSERTLAVAIATTIIRVRMSIATFRLSSVSSVELVIE